VRIVGFLVEAIPVKLGFSLSLFFSLEYVVTSILHDDEKSDLKLKWNLIGVAVRLGYYLSGSAISCIFFEQQQNRPRKVE
jgi:hypothetical protein